jgi:hypothetical protein
MLSREQNDVLTRVRAVQESEIPLLKEEGWLRHQSLERAQTGWSVSSPIERPIRRQ